jgi:hypothetical protein
MKTEILSAALLIGFGISLLLHTMLAIPTEAISIRISRRNRWERMLAEGREKTVQRVNLRRVDFPFVPALFLSLVTGMLLWTAFGDSPLRFCAMFALLVPIAIRRWLEFNRTQRVDSEVRALLTDLRMELACGGTMLTALQAVAANGPKLLAGMIRSYLSGYTESGLAIIGWLAEDTQNVFLQDLTARAEAAQQGGLDMDEAVRQSLQRVVEESNTRLREELQRSPGRLTLISIPLILLPLGVLWVVPLGATLLASFNGEMGGGY